jgi:hypothetical protein
MLAIMRALKKWRMDLIGVDLLEPSARYLPDRQLEASMLRQTIDFSPNLCMISTDMVHLPSYGLFCANYLAPYFIKPEGIEFLIGRAAEYHLVLCI